MALSNEVREVIKAGREYKHKDGIGVRSILEGHAHAEVQRIAQAYAEREARAGKQLGHAGWNERFREVLGHFPSGYYAAENTAESWDWQTTIEEAAPDFFRSWNHSSGHWASINGPCDWYGYGVAQAKSGVWLCTAIIVQGSKHGHE